MNRKTAALRRFALSITAFNVIGHLYFGFEQSILQPLVCMATAYLLEAALESVDSWATGRRPRFLEAGWRNRVDFFLSAHITALAVGMLLYANDRLAPMIFATALAIASKTLLRAMIDGRSVHFLNPSNFGITMTLLLFPAVGIAPPYHFTENLGTIGDVLLPLGIVCLGSLLNAALTGKIHVSIGWGLGFVVQALIRAAAGDASLAAALAPTTGVAFVLFTFYMVTDPSTTPRDPRAQLVFGASVALVYGALVASHVVFGFFFALTIVTGVRGVAAWLTPRAVVSRAPALSVTDLSPGRRE